MPKLKTGKPLPVKKIDLSSIMKEGKDEKEKPKEKEQRAKSITIRPEIEKQAPLNLSATPSGDKIAISAGKEISKNNKSVSVNVSKEVSEEPIRYSVGARATSEKGRSLGIGYESDKTISADYSSPKGNILAVRYNPKTKSGGASYSSPKGRTYGADVDLENKSANLDYATAKGARFSLGGSYGDEKSIDATYSSKRGNTFIGSYNPDEKTARFGAILKIGRKRK